VTVQPLRVVVQTVTRSGKIIAIQLRLWRPAHPASLPRSEPRTLMFGLGKKLTGVQQDRGHISPQY